MPRNGSRAATRIQPETILTVRQIAKHKPVALSAFDMREYRDSDKAAIGGDLKDGLIALVVCPSSDQNEVAGYIVFDLKSNIHWVWVRECYRLRGIAKWLLTVTVGAQPFWYEYDAITADGENFLLAVSNELEQTQHN